MGRFVIKTPVPAISGRHWELDFTDGVAETDSEEIARNYEARGYTVESSAAAEDKPAKKTRARKS